MSYRYRLIHVDANRTQELRRFNFNFVDAERNDCNSGAGRNNIPDFDEWVSALKNTNAGLDSIPRNLLMFVADSSAVSLFNSFGFSNVISARIFSVGDRLYVDRWDNSHSYLEVTNIGTDYKTIQFTYKCADGTTYIAPSLNLNYDNTSVTASSLLLCSNFSNWTQANQAGVQCARCFIFRSNNLAGGALSMMNSGFTLATAEKFWSTAKPLDGDNPYAEAGYTSLGGGDPDKQNWEDESDSVTADALPTIGALNSGMVSVFSPSAIQLSDLADLLFSYNFFDWLQKNLQNLEELFVSLGTVPFAVSKGPAQSVTWLGFDVSQFTHPVYLPPVTEQFPEINMGSIAFDGSDPRIHTTDSVFDYSPFSTLGIYLPFIGFQELDIDEIRGSVLSLRYRIDVVSGTCIAIINVTDEQGSRDLYQFSGNCLTQIPMGSVDISGIISGSVQIATAAVSAGATSAIASAGGEAIAETSAAGKITETQAELRSKQYAAQVSNARGNLVSATANGMMGMKPNYRHSGAIGNSGSMIAVKQPYIFLKTPREAVPENYQKYCGLPANITATLGSCSGYVVVEDIRLNGLVATSPEVEEIYRLLKSGVIV